MKNQRNNNSNSDTRTDGDILRASLEDPLVFGVLVDRYQKPFLRKVGTVLRSKEDIEDVVQETFTKIYVYGRKYVPKEGATFRSWAYKILMNTALTHYQRIKRTRAMVDVGDEHLFDLHPSPGGDFVEAFSVQDFILTTFSRMPSSLVRALKLHFLEEYSQKEIAEKEHTTLSAIKTRIYRAKAEFRRIHQSLN